MVGVGNDDNREHFTFDMTKINDILKGLDLNSVT